MTPEAVDSKLGRASAGFALAAAITVLREYRARITKDACAPLKAFMKSLAGHDWTTQGIADMALFILLGLIFSQMDLDKSIGSRRLICLLTAASVIAGVVLTAWYILY